MLKIIKKKISNSYEEPLKSSHITTFLNPYSYLMLRKHRAVLEHFDNIMIDGGLLVSFLNAVGIRSRRISFDMTSLAPFVFDWAVQNDKAIYMIGAQQADIELAVAHYRQEYPQINIIEFRNGYFSDAAEQEAAIEHILKISPDVLIVGMGAIKQEQFLLQLKKTGRWAGIAFTCGGFFHQTAKKGVEYYPAVFNKLNLRWLYRMIDEPALIKRYFIYYPWFAWAFLADWIRWKKGAQKQSS